MAWGVRNDATGLAERASLHALEQIWRFAICGGGGEPGVGLAPSELKHACVVLVMPDLFERRFCSSLLSVLLSEACGLGFKAAIVHEEAACATFGAGVGSACVVDIGHQRATVCCVDEGTPMPGCRQILSYGGADMDVLLHVLLHRQRLAAAVPHLTGRPSYAPTAAAAHSLRTIRQGAVSLKLTAEDPEDTTAELPSAGGSVQLGAMRALPPLLLFAPSVAARLQTTLQFERPANASASSSCGVAWDHADVWDDDFISETALDRALPAGATPAGPKDVFLGAANFAPTLTAVGLRHAPGLTPDGAIGFTPLDEAVVRAVERGKSTEVKRRLYGTILLLGGGARTKGLAEYLEWRISSCWHIAADATEGVERVEVMRFPEGTEPDSLAWRGAALLPQLETGRTLWVTAGEWGQRGPLAARERFAFSW